MIVCFFLLYVQIFGEKQHKVNDPKKWFKMCISDYYPQKKKFNTR